ncbi:MAG: peroxiredoxin-like family protein [Thiohalobacteraceae bacterium]|nr:AhpC/TSA family protein [Gammaproteobacteria bacterium]
MTSDSHSHCTSQTTDRNTTSLQAELDQLVGRYTRTLPDDVQGILRTAIQELTQSGIAEECLRVGMRPLDFTLPNQHGQAVNLHATLAEGPVVISFFRGLWCPYCSLELGALQRALPEIRAAGATLLAISPQTPAQSTTTAAQLALQFDVLSDAHNRVAASFGLVFSLPEMLRPIYRNFGIDIPACNGDDSYELPMAATYVLDRDGLIRLAFADTDYTKRLDPAQIIACLQTL